MLRRHPDLADTPLIAGWTRQGFPVIVRRRLGSDAADAVPAALPLPPSHGKRRIAFTLSPSDVVSLPPVPLRDAAGAAPRAWQGVVAALLELGDSSGVEPCVFGALLWEHLTGLAYLTDRSDLDLIWPVQDDPFPDRLLAGLRRLDAAGPVRLDGEVALPDGRAVNWRELAHADGASAEVLVKTLEGVAASPVAELFTMPNAAA